MGLGSNSFSNKKIIPDIKSLFGQQLCNLGMFILTAGITFLLFSRTFKKKIENLIAITSEDANEMNFENEYLETL